MTLLRKKKENSIFKQKLYFSKKIIIISRPLKRKTKKCRLYLII